MIGYNSFKRAVMSSFPMFLQKTLFVMVSTFENVTQSFFPQKSSVLYETDVIEDNGKRTTDVNVDSRMKLEVEKLDINI